MMLFSQADTDRLAWKYPSRWKEFLFSYFFFTASPGYWFSVAAVDSLPEASAMVCIHMCRLGTKPSPMAAPASGMPFPHHDTDEIQNVSCPGIVKIKKKNRMIKEKKKTYPSFLTCSRSYANGFKGVSHGTSYMAHNIMRVLTKRYVAQGEQNFCSHDRSENMSGRCGPWSRPCRWYACVIIHSCSHSSFWSTRSSIHVVLGIQLSAGHIDMAELDPCTHTQSAMGWGWGRCSDYKVPCSVQWLQ